MSRIRKIVMGNINGYDIAKTGKWDKPEPPPPNTFDLQEIYAIGDMIISELEGLLSDKLIDK